jgi:hypothetical protein
MAKRATRTRPERSPKARSKKSTAAEVEVVEEEGGSDVDSGIGIVTTIVLLAAFLMIDAMRGMYGEGLFM